MNLSQLGLGDVVYAATDIRNDGGIPDVAADAMLATRGTRGVIVNIGTLEQAPDRTLFLVRFENASLELGPPTGCWAHELTAEASGTGQSGQPRMRS
jgi:nitrogen fixation protein NifZ